MIADIIIILIMALCIFLGYIRGLIKVTVKIIGLFAALIIALIFYTPVSNYIIDNTDIVQNLEHTIESKLNGADETQETEKVDTNYTLESSIENYIEGVKEEGIEYISRNIAISIVRVRNMDRFICNSKNTNAIYKIICKYNRKNTSHKTIQ